MILETDKGSVIPGMCPAQSCFASCSVLRAVDAKQDGADDVEFCDQDVDQGVLVPLEILKSENMASDGADRVGFSGVNTGFRDKLCDDGFGKDVEKVEEERRPSGGGACGRGGW